MEQRDEYLTAEQVAVRLVVKPTWVGEKARLGIIPSYKIGHYRRYRWSEVEAWMKQSQES